jgi:ribosomal-protein-alanine N-acetyltransferase
MIETDRLMIIPLNQEQLDLYLQADDKFENLFELACTGRRVVPDVKEMVEKFTLSKMKIANADNYLFYTFWIVVEKSSRSIVAELGFKGEPNKDGEIEIGYGTLPNSRNKGFMTEAVGAMIKWASNREGVRWLLAETDETNIASIRIVQKNNFRFD